MIEFKEVKNQNPEQVCLYYAIYANKFEVVANMTKQPVDELQRYRELFNSFVVNQSPYIDNAGNVRYSDISIYSKQHNVDIRYEIGSLNPKSEISSRVLRYIQESKNIPEKLLVLVLLGNGYDDIVEYYAKPLIRKEKLNITIIRSMDNYKKHINNIFQTL